MSFMKKMPAPLTEEELKEKISNPEKDITMPKGLSGIMSGETPEFKEIETGKTKFNHVDIRGVGYEEELIGVDSKGAEHKFGGGCWINLNWSVQGFGFGEISLKRLPDGTIEIDTERLGKEFAKAMFCDLIDKAKERE